MTFIGDGGPRLGHRNFVRHFFALAQRRHQPYPRGQVNAAGWYDTI